MAVADHAELELARGPVGPMNVSKGMVWRGMPQTRTFGKLSQELTTSLLPSSRGICGKF